LPQNDLAAQIVEELLDLGFGTRVDEKLPFEMLRIVRRRLAKRNADIRKAISCITQRVEIASNGIHNSWDWDSLGPVDELTYWEWIHEAEEEALALAISEYEEEP